MTKKEALNKILGLIKKTVFAEDAPAVKLADGTMVQSTLEPGSPISFLDADGVATPAAAGEYELEDARIVVVTEEGVVAEVKEAAPAEDEDLTKQPAENAAALAAVQSQLDAEKAALAAVTAEFTAHKKASQKFQADTTELLKQMHSLIEVLSREESAEPAGEVRQTAFAAKRAEKEAAREKMRDGFKKFTERLKK